MNCSTFDTIRNYIHSLALYIVEENTEEEVFIVKQENMGISNLIIDCEAPVLILEQHLFQIPKPSIELYTALLQKNRFLLRGSFFIDTKQENIFFHDSLLLKDLSFDQFAASIHAVTFAVYEHGKSLINILEK